MKKRHALGACLSATLLLVSLAGCSTQSSVSADEAKHIKGGAMPPDAAKAMAAQRDQWAKTHQMWNGPTPGAPGGPPAGAGSSNIPPPPGGPPQAAGGAAGK